MIHPGRRKPFGLALLLLTLWSGLSRGFDAQSNEGPGVVLLGEPEVPSELGDLLSEPDYHCPLQGGGPVILANGDAGSHLDAFNRYAWDWGAAVGTAVVAARGGVVVRSVNRWVIGGPGSEWIPYNNEVQIRHSDGTVGVYLHLRLQDDPPRVGEWVLQGEQIGFSGDTGWSLSDHLHFTVQRDGRSIPAAFSDFKTRGGVPIRGDRHAAPPPPRVAQALIDIAKARHRAAARALRSGLPDIALAILTEALKRPLPPDYPYASALRDLEKSARKSLETMIEDLRSREAEDRDAGLILARLRLASASPGGKDRNPAAGTGAGSSKEMAAARPHLAAWREGLLEWAREKPRAALQLWRDMPRSHPAIDALLAPQRERLASEVLAGTQSRLDDLERQRGACPPERAAALAAAAKALANEARPLLAEIGRQIPGTAERVAAITAALDVVAPKKR